MKPFRSLAPLARVTLRAYQPAPARVELAYLPLPGRILRALLSLCVCWGLIPLLMWLPPHYPWVVGALVAGAYLAHRQWNGQYYVSAFAGVCPRCGHALSLGVDRTIRLPHTLTCFHCHFEPLLEVRFAPESGGGELTHYSPDCVGLWKERWLADEPFLVCERCFAHASATPDAQRMANAENERAELLIQLTGEGRTLL